MARRRRLLLSRHGSLGGWLFHTLDSLALAVGAEIAGAAALVAPGDARRQLDQAYARAAAEVFPEWSACRQCPQEIADAVSCLRLNQIAAPTADGEQDARTQLLCRTRTYYETDLGATLDRDGCILALTDLLERTAQSKSPDGDLPYFLTGLAEVELIGFRDDEPWQRRFANACEACWKVCFPGDWGRGIFAEKTRAAMTGNQVASAVGLVFPDEISLVRAPSPDLEIVHAARGVAGLLVDESSGATPEDVLIVAPADAVWRRRLAAALDDYRIPHDVALGASLAESPLGSFCIRLAKTPIEPLHYEDFLLLIGSPYLSLGALRQGEARASLRTLSQLIRRRRFRSGAWSQWLEIAASLEAEARAVLEKEEASEVEDEERPSARGRRMLEAATAFGDAVRALQAIYDLPAIQSAEAWSQWLLGLLAQFRLFAKRAASAEHLHDADKAAYAEVKTCLEQLAEEVVQPMDRSAFAERLTAALERRRLSSTGSWLQAVSVRSVEQVEKGHWRHVFIVGMNEGVFPPEASGVGGLLTDAVRQAAGLPDRHVRNAANGKIAVRVLADAAETADGLSLSYAATDFSGKAIAPSVYLQRLDDALAEWRQEDGFEQRIGHFLPSAEHNNRFRRLSPKSCLPSAATVFTAEEFLIASNLTDRAVDDSLLQQLPDSLRDCQRAANEFADWGRLRHWNREDETQSAMTCFGDVATDKGFSPSQLDKFGACPYSYFAARVLKVERPRSLDLAADPMTVGTLVHEVLEEVLDECPLGYFAFADENERDLRLGELRRAVAAAMTRRINEAGAVGVGIPQSAGAAHLERWRQTVIETAVKPMLQPAAESLRDKAAAELKALAPNVDELRASLQAWIALESTVSEKLDKAEAAGGDVAVDRALLAAYRQGRRQWEEALADPSLESLGPEPPASKPSFGFKAKSDGVNMHAKWKALSAARRNWLSLRSAMAAGTHHEVPNSKKALKDSIKQLAQSEQIQPLAFEWRLEGEDGGTLAVDLGDGVVMRLHGIVDRLDLVRQWPDRTLVRVTDYKTSKKTATSADVAAGMVLQLSAYAVAVAERLRRGSLAVLDEEVAAALEPDDVEVALLSLRKGPPSPRSEPMPAGGELLQLARRHLREAQQRIASGHLAPAPKANCPVRNGPNGYCQYASLCRVRTIPEDWFRQVDDERGEENQP